MSLTYANYEAILLDGTAGNVEFDLNPFNSNGVRTATTVHQIYSIAGGTIAIFPFKCNSCDEYNNDFYFQVAFNKNQKIDVLTRKVIITGGVFIAFRSKFETNPFYSSGNNQ